MQNGYTALAQAIIVQACKDYREELLWLKMHKPIIPEDEEDAKYIEHKAEARSLEEFFRSGWFSTLSDLDGQYLMNRIRKEFEDDK